MTIAIVSGPTEGAVAQGSQTEASVSVAATAGDVILHATDWGASVSVSSVTCSGETVLLDPGGTRTIQGMKLLWSAIRVASTGTKNIVSTFTGELLPGNARSFAFVLSGVIAAGDPFNEGGTGSGMFDVISANVTTTVDNCAMFAVFYGGSDSTSPNGGYTRVELDNFATYESGFYLVDVGAAGSKTVTVTNTNISGGGIIAIAIEPEVASGATKYWQVDSDTASAFARKIIIYDTDGVTQLDSATNITADASGIWEFEAANQALAAGTERLAVAHDYNNSFAATFKCGGGKAVIVEV